MALVNCAWRTQPIPFLRRICRKMIAILTRRSGNTTLLLQKAVILMLSCVKGIRDAMMTMKSEQDAAMAMKSSITVRAAIQMGAHSS